MLSKRLAMILGLVNACETLADVGSDHGYLALEALKTHKAIRVIAADVRKGPLKQAQKTFAEANVFDHVDFILSDGIQAIPDPIDCVVISGMGAELILKIITQDLERFKRIPQLVVQSNSKQHELRTQMAKLGFSMIAETITLDKHYYIAQRYHYTGLCEALDEFQSHFGQLIDLKDPIYRAYLANEADKLHYILRYNPDSAHHLNRYHLIKTRLNERVE